MEGVEPGSLPLGLRFVDSNKDPYAVSFRVWAPFPRAARLLVSARKKKEETAVAEETETETDTETETKKETPGKETEKTLTLQRHVDTHSYWGVFLADDIRPGDDYRLFFELPDGRTVERFDAYARSIREGPTGECWNEAVDNRASSFPWTDGYTLRPFEEYIIYEMHVGSFTPEGTLKSAEAKLDHVGNLGFTAVELLPLAEFSHKTESWGYNPRLQMALHRAYGSPEDLKSFVDAAHRRGIAVIVDVVLHHGAVDGNLLWDYDGWEQAANGGIYHEGAPDNDWGRSYAFWKKEVRDMLCDTCCMWLDEYKCDGLRFDSANDLPRDLIQHTTWLLHEKFPGRILTAEITPENPQLMHELGFDSLWTHSGYFDIIQQHRALGRGHHGGGDWAEGWNLPRLRTVMGLHYGFNWPTHCIKYILGSHDQVGCKHGGRQYEDYKMIGGQHRYAADQFGGGRHDGPAMAASRLWYTANVCAACLPMVFMGTEWMQPGWWNSDEHHRLKWELSEDAVGRKFSAFMRDANALRETYPNLRHGECNILHEDRPNGVLAFERVTEGGPDLRLVVVVNAGRTPFQEGNYGCWVKGGEFEEVFSSQAPTYGGWGGWKTNGGIVRSHEGKIWLNIPEQCTLVFKQHFG